MKNVYEVIGYSDAFTSKKNNKDYIRIFAVREGDGIDHGMVCEGPIVTSPDRITGGKLTVGCLVRIFYDRRGFVDEVEVIE